MSRSQRENWIGLLSFGFFIFLFALFFVIVPNYGETVLKFFQDFEFEEVAPNVFLPFPTSKPYHKVVYETTMYFCLVFGIFQFAILALRLSLRSSLTQMAETVSGIVFWMGTTLVFYGQAVLPNTVEWLSLIGGIIAVIGFSLISRSVITLLFQRRR